MMPQPFSTSAPSDRHRFIRALTSALAWTLGLLWVTALQAEPALRDAINALNQKGFTDKGRAIDALVETNAPGAPTVLEALLEGALYYRKSDGQVFVAQETEEGLDLLDPVSGERMDQVGFRDARRISINNQLRTQLRGAIAGMQLNAGDPEVRLLAANGMIANPDLEFLPALDQAIAQEKKPAILGRLRLARSLIVARNAEAPEADRVLAVADLQGALDPGVRQLLAELVIRNDDGSYRETSAAVREAAQGALQAIESRVRLYRWIENLFFGLSLGSVLLLAAVGLAITFGVMGVINMAHGEMLMLGAYTTYVIQQAFPQALEYSLALSIPAAFLVAGGVGVFIERTVIRHLYGRPLETLLATFGISLILQQLVRSIFSPLNRSVTTPEWMSGSWQINGALSLTYNRLYIIVFSLVVFGALLVLLNRTRLGLNMRAVTQNRQMARALGIRSGWVDAMTFGLGSGIAGVGGVALSQLTNVGPNLGQAYIIDSFMVVVFGGVGNLWGTFFGAMTLGVANKYLEPFAGAVLAKILVLVFIILFIQRRPRGLFALKGRAAEA